MTTTSTTSASSPLPVSPAQALAPTDPAITWTHDEDEERAFGDDVFKDGDLPLEGEEGRELVEDDYFPSFSQEHLPHVPLRPFRNQVGGHTSIYKFTKRAVCKVIFFFFSYSWTNSIV